MQIDETEVNGQPAAVVSKDGHVFAVVAAIVSQDGIRQLLWMMNPQKLGAVSSRGA